MLPKNQRIPRKMFPLLSNGAKVFKNNVFLLRFVSGKEEKSRFCFSISKKVAKKAVMRNKMRRAGYRLLKKYIPDIKSNILAIFSFKITPKNDEEIDKNLEAILKEAKLIK
jgi:ribonuclease P protein component